MLTKEECALLIRLTENTKGYHKLKGKLLEAFEKTPTAASKSSALAGIEEISVTMPKEEVTCANIETKVFNGDEVTSEEEEYYFKIRGYRL